MLPSVRTPGLVHSVVTHTVERLLYAGSLTTKVVRVRRTVTPADRNVQVRTGSSGRNALPFEILKHEFNHLLLGGNNFHSGGGNAAQFGSYTQCMQGGWSMMGAASSSLLTCSGWDRDRLGWRPEGAPFAINAHRLDRSPEVIRAAVGQEGTVYIPIPAAKANTGKVQLKLQNRLVEYEAVTSSSQKLATGTKVRVVGVTGKTLEVEPLSVTSPV